MYPATQVQLYPLTISLQVAELLHGEDAHSFISVNVCNCIDKIGSADVCLDIGGSRMGGGVGGRATGQNVLKFYVVFQKFWQNLILAPPAEGLVSPHTGNSGSVHVRAWCTCQKHMGIPFQKWRLPKNR